MVNAGSVTGNIRDLQEGRRREEAVRALWERFFAELARHAVRKLRNGPLADAEDAAIVAFTKVCRDIESGRLRLASRIDLRRLLLAVTSREAIDLFAIARRGDRGLDGATISQVPDPAPPPDLVVSAEVAFGQLLELLGDDELRQIALWKLDGRTNEEIGERLECSLATVERKLRRIRGKLSAHAPDRVARPGPR